MKLKNIEMMLESIQGFENPKIKLEQYETGFHIGARMLFTMNSYDDIEEMSILDLGTGCGRLGIGCAFMQASYVLGVDVDQDALKQCSSNVLNLQEEENEPCLNNFDTVLADVCNDLYWDRTNKMFDIVVMNPPFGTKQNKGIDMVFLKRAIDSSTKAVYSLHKSSTRDHVLKKARDFGVQGEVLAQLRYDLPNTYKFHKKQSKDIEVDFLRFEHASYN